MRYLAAILLLVSVAVAEESTCLIVKPTSTAYRLTISNKAFQYVTGEFPKGMKFHSSISDGDVRKIQEHGGKVVVVNHDYSGADLEAAQKSCQPNQKIAEKR